MRSSPRDADPAAAATWAAIRIWAGGRNLTAHSRTDSMTALDALHWPAAFLARWFVNGWEGFWERAGRPLPGPVVDAEQACASLDTRLTQLEDLAADQAVDRLVDERDAFVASHSLLVAAGGGVMPHVYLLRQARSVQVRWAEPVDVDSTVRFHHLSGQVAVDAGIFLESIRGFLLWCRGAVGSAAPEFRTAMDRWNQRVDGSDAASAILRGYVRPWGVAAERRLPSTIEDELELSADWRDEGALLDPSRFAVAVVYRSLTPILDPADIRSLVQRLRRYPANLEASAKIDELRSTLTEVRSLAPHRRGYELAIQVREQLGNRDAVLDIVGEMSRLGVAIASDDLSDPDVDAATV